MTSNPAKAARTNHPIDRVQWLPLETIHANTYNPNQVSAVEMALLRRSIEADGITQPLVVCPDPAGGYQIVDGFHRYTVISTTPSIRAGTADTAPCVIIDKPLADRMASTVRHNRARGRHRTDGMANLIFAMLEQGMDDATVCNELGMAPEELIRLKHVTGFSRLFADRDYNREWLTKNQIRARLRYQAEQAAADEQVTS